jgi:hypothetical protein
MRIEDGHAGDFNEEGDENEGFDLFFGGVFAWLGASILRE